MGRMGWMPNRATGRPMVEEGLAPAPVYRSRAGSGSDGARGVFGVSSNHIPHSSISSTCETKGSSHLGAISETFNSGQRQGRDL